MHEIKLQCRGSLSINRDSERPLTFIYIRIEFFVLKIKINIAQIETLDYTARNYAMLYNKPVSQISIVFIGIRIRALKFIDIRIQFFLHKIKINFAQIARNHAMLCKPVSQISIVFIGIFIPLLTFIEFRIQLFFFLFLHKNKD